MKFKILFIALFISLVSIAQNIKEKELIGTWKTSEVISAPLSDDLLDKLETFKQIFINSTFVFKEDHSFYLSSQVEEMSNMFSNKYWYINKKKKLLMIIDPKDVGTSSRGLIEITVKKEDDNLIFIIEETPLKLTMVKQ